MFRQFKVVFESLSAHMAKAEPFRVLIINLMKEVELLLSQMCNGDETCFSQKSVSFNSETWHQKKMLTPLVCMSAYRSHHFMSVVVDKAGPLSHMNIVNKLPEHYAVNKSPWFTRDIFHSFHKYFLPTPLARPRNTQQAILQILSAHTTS